MNENPVRQFAADCSKKIKLLVDDKPKEWAFNLGISLSAMYNYMNGRVPSVEVLYRFSQVSGKPMEWFLTDEQEIQKVA